MLTRRLCARQGFTLAELLLVLVLGGIVLGIASSVGVRLQRELGTLSASVAADEQLAAAAEVLPIDLRGLVPNAGDILGGAASDTSLELRATIGSAIVCGSAPGTTTVAFLRAAGGRITTPRAAPGDTLWLFEDADDGERWRPVALAALRRANGLCAAVDPTADQVIDRSHLWAADLHDSSLVQRGAVVRITRPERLSFYRASDARWYLGLRSWNSDAGTFNGVQPIAGPFRAPTSSHGVKLVYFDSAGSPVASGSADTRRIARIEALLTVDDPDHGSAAVDSFTVVAALRNRDD